MKHAYNRLIIYLLMTVCVSLSFVTASAGQADKQTIEQRVRIIIDRSEAPECDIWATNAYRAIRTWYPKISEMLRTDGFTPRNEVRLKIRAKYDGIAATGGDVIDVSADWIKQHPDDIGMALHEVVHWIQQYPDYNTPWLVEGIADYIRYFEFEPRKEYPVLDPGKSSYRDGYMTTAMFLAWVKQEKRETIISDMNNALRKGEYEYDLWREYTGQNLDRLWSEFIEIARRKDKIAYVNR